MSRLFNDNNAVSSFRTHAPQGDACGRLRHRRAGAHASNGHDGGRGPGRRRGRHVEAAGIHSGWDVRSHPHRRPHSRNGGRRWCFNLAFQMVPNTFEGSDITIAGTSGVNGKTLVECQEACDAEATCTGFAKTFHPDHASTNPCHFKNALGGDADQYVNYYLPGNGNGWAFALHYPLVRDEQPHAASRIVRSLEPFPGFLRSVLNCPAVPELCEYELRDTPLRQPSDTHGCSPWGAYLGL